MALLAPLSRSSSPSRRPGSSAPASPGPIVTWRAADVLGTPVVEGIVVEPRLDLAHRDRQRRRLAVRSAADRQAAGAAGTRVRWLRAGARDGLAADQIAVDIVPGREARLPTCFGSDAASRSRLVRAVHGHGSSPRRCAKHEDGIPVSARGAISGRRVLAERRRSSRINGVSDRLHFTGNDEADRLLVRRADGAADRLRARPAGARPDRVHGPAEAEAAARHARPGPDRDDRPGDTRGCVPREAGDPPLPREHGPPGAGARGRGGGALRRAGGAALD